MDGEQFRYSVGLVAVGSILTLASNWVASIFQSKREHRASKRKEDKALAQEILDLIDEANEHFDGLWDQGSSPPQNELRSVTRKLERHALLLESEVARRNIEWAATAFFQVGALEQMGEGPPARAAGLIRNEARKTLGALGRGEPIEDSKPLQEFDAAIADFYTHPDK